MTVPTSSEDGPEGLGKAGSALWTAVLGEFEFRPDELMVLEQACRTADTVWRLDEALVGAPLTVPGSMGQLREHPLIAEVRQQRMSLARLLSQLALTDDQAASIAAKRSAAGRALARQRWSPKVVA